MPFLWAARLSRELGVGYLQMLGFYRPELVVGGLVLVSLTLSFRSKSAARIGFLSAAVLAPLLTLILGSPTNGVWLVSTALLFLCSWCLRPNAATKTGL